jgi:hypothetical protein
LDQAPGHHWINGNLTSPTHCLGLGDLVENRRPEFVKAKELKCPLPVEIENPQIVALAKIVLHNKEMASVALPRDLEWNLEGDEFLNAFLPQPLQETWVGYRGIGRQNDKWTTPGQQHDSLHDDVPFYQRVTPLWRAQSSVRIAAVVGSYQATTRLGVRQRRITTLWEVALL